MDQFLNFEDFEAFALLSVEDYFADIKLLNVFGRGNSALFVTKEDKVYGIGHNRSGCLGLGHWKEDLRKPQLSQTLSGKQLVDIVTGFEHCLGLTASGQLYSWGQNKYGQLGIGSQSPTPNPTLIEELAEERVVQISCGAYHSLALTSDGDLFSWGHNTFAQLGDRTYNSREVPTQVLVNEKVVSVSCGVNHSLALTTTGNVYIWGNNTNGQLGRNPDCDQRGREKPMSNRPKLIRGLDNVVIKRAVCGPNHSFILTTDGCVYAFGDNSYGQIGNGSTDPQYTPFKLNNDLKIKDIYCHFDNDLSIAVSEDNKCFIWGMASNRKVLKPKLIANSFGKSLFDIYAKFAKNSITFQTVNIEDINGFVVKSEDFEPNNRINELKVNSIFNANQNQFKDYEKELNISPRNEFNAEEEDKEELEDFEKEKILTEDFICNRSPKKKNNSSLAMTSISGTEFLRHLYQSFNNADNYDLKIISGDQVIYCHKTVLQIRNQGFWEFLSREIIEDQNEIKINPKSNELFHAFLQHMYGIEPEIDVRIVEDLKKMAKIFGESELQHLCDQLIKKWGISINVSNVCALYENAVNEGLTELETNCIAFVAHNWKSIITSDAFISMDASLSKRLMISVHN